MDAASLDDWPHTSRVMPWLVAAFLVMIFVVPFDSIRLPIPMPVDSTPDRVLLPLMAGVWLCGLFTMRNAIRPLQRTWVSVAIFLFVVIAIASILVNFPVLVHLEALKDGWKRLAVLLSYVLFFVIVATSIRKTELRAFGTLIVGLACLTAIGTIWEYRTGYNVFYSLTETLARGGVTVLSPLQAVAHTGVYSTGSRPQIIGPAAHGLAVCTMMGFALPIAIIRILDTKAMKRVIWIGAAGLMLAGSIATLRKTGAILPLAVILVLTAYRPKPMLRTFLPVALVLFALIQVLAPSALSNVTNQLSPEQIDSSSSTQGRLSDYGAVRPAVLDRPALGQGFGTYLHQTNRFIDNEYLKRALETGFLGVIAYLFMVIAVMAVADRSIRSSDLIRAGPAQAATAGAFAYGVAGFLFDELFFPQAPYLFFFAAATVVILAAPQVASRRLGVLSGGMKEAVPSSA